MTTTTNNDIGILAIIFIIFMTISMGIVFTFRGICRRINKLFNLIKKGKVNEK